MNESLISVVIPVYNLENHIARCIDSVLKQTYSNFEIIAVDDGSTDGSTEILKQYSKIDSRVKPIFKKNGGVSSARNRGIDEAKGEYIYFLDGDDWIKPDALEKLLNFSKGFDIVQAAYIESYSDGTEKVPSDAVFTDKEITDTKEMLASYFLAEIHESCCNKLYRKSVIGDSRFDVNLAVAEDSSFVYGILKKTRNIKLLSVVTYHYYIREDSCMHTVIEDKHFLVLQLRDRQYEEAKADIKLFEKFIFRYAKDIFFLLHGILHDESRKFAYRIFNLRIRILQEKKFIFLSSYLNLRFKIGVFILWLCPKLFYKIYSK